MAYDEEKEKSREDLEN
jgi:hypothetical protein